MKVMLDTNVLLDLFLDREPWNQEATLIWEAHERGVYEAFVSAIAPPTVFYILRKQGIDVARRAIARMLATVEVAPVDKVITQAAYASGMTDFEDAIQHEAAQAAGVDVIVTRDLSDFAGATLPVLAPADFLRQIAPR